MSHRFPVAHATAATLGLAGCEYPVHDYRIEVPVMLAEPHLARSFFFEWGIHDHQPVQPEMVGAHLGLVVALGGAVGYTGGGNGP